MINWQDISTWRILVVDDEPDNIEVVAETLEFRGAEVKTATNGKEAIDVLEGFDANLILTDLSMPVMNGWEMRSRIQSNPKLSGIPILALSAHAIAGDPERAIEAGFNGYLTKPVNILTLVEDIRSTVNTDRVVSMVTDKAATDKTATDSAASVVTDNADAKEKAS